MGRDAGAPKPSPFKLLTATIMPPSPTRALVPADLVGVACRKLRGLAAAPAPATKGEVAAPDALPHAPKPARVGSGGVTIVVDGKPNLLVVHAKTSPPAGDGDAAAPKADFAFALASAVRCLSCAFAFSNG